MHRVRTGHPAITTPPARIVRRRPRQDKRKPRSPELVESIATSLAHLERPLVCQIAPSTNVHARLNPGFVCYSGHEQVSCKLSDSKVRARALQAMDDMTARFHLDFPHLSPKSHLPGAMGVQIVEMDKGSKGFDIFYHSSMKQNKPPIYHGEEIALAANLKRLMITDDDGNLPTHRRTYRCTEPGLFTNSETTRAGSAPGSRMYFVDTNGQFLPPCESEAADEIGCRDIVGRMEAVTVSDGPASINVEGGTTSYFWYDTRQIKPRISFTMVARTASRIAKNIAAEMVAEENNNDTTGTRLIATTAGITLTHRQYGAKIRNTACEMAIQIAQILNRKVASRLSGHLGSSDAYSIALNAAKRAAFHLNSPSSTSVSSSLPNPRPIVDPSLDTATNCKITDKVVEAVARWAEQRVEDSKTVVRSMTLITAWRNQKRSPAVDVEHESTARLTVAFSKREDRWVRLTDRDLL